MKELILTILLLSKFLLYSQNRGDSWIDNIDITDYKVYFRKGKVPRDFSKLTKIRRFEMTGPKGNFAAGCSGPGKYIRLNWLAMDKENHTILSVSFGGAYFETRYYFLDYESGHPDLNTRSFVGNGKPYLDFKEVISQINGNTEFYKPN